MAERTIGIRVSITRYVSDDPQPGIVECEFFDAHGRRWTFIEKTAYVSSEQLDAETHYPHPGVVICEIVGRTRDSTGKEIISVNTERRLPDLEPTGGSTQFEVSPASLVEWEWGSDVKRPWEG